MSSSCVVCEGSIEKPHPLRKRCTTCQDNFVRDYNRQRYKVYRKRRKKLSEEAPIKLYSTHLPVLKCKGCGKNHFAELLKMQLRNGELSEIKRFLNQEELHEQLKRNEANP